MSEATVGKVLVLDDYDSERAWIDYHLSSAIGNLEIIEASTIAEAEMMVREEKPDIAIVDLMVDQSDSIDFSHVDRIASMGNVPVLVWTSLAPMAFDGVHDTCHKSNTEGLIAWVKHHLPKKSDD